LSLNQYVYGGVSPVTFSDPTGFKLVGGGGTCKRTCQNEAQQEIEEAGGSYECVTCSPATEPPFDPTEYKTWIDEHARVIRVAAEAFHIRPSVIAGVLAVEFEYDKDNLGEAAGEFGFSKWCGAPLLGRLGCETRSFGAGQIQIRRAELVDSKVREAFSQICDGDDCAAFVREFWDGRGNLVGRLRNEGTNILYIAAYLDRLRHEAPAGATWKQIYGTVYNSAVGSYNPDPKYAAGFAGVNDSYSYLDST
jgi:hypothetical protein